MWDIYKKVQFSTELVTSKVIRTNFDEFALVFLHVQVVFYLFNKSEFYKEIEKGGQASLNQKFITCKFWL